MKIVKVNDHYEMDEKRTTLKDISKSPHCHAPYSTLISRLQRGWTIGEALAPAGKKVHRRFNSSFYM